MNKFVKIIIAFLAGLNTTFNLFLPIAIAILWILKFGFEFWGSYLIMILAMCSTLYKAIDIGILERE